jgi:hypothetical protein
MEGKKNFNFDYVFFSLVCEADMIIKMKYSFGLSVIIVFKRYY